MNTPIRRLSVALLLVFGALLANANYVQVISAADLNERPDNRRVLLAEYDRERGSILVGDQQRQLARSVPSGGDYAYRREYAQGPTYAPATGYYSFVYGRSAVERAYNDILSGADDRLFVRRVVDLVTGRKPAGGSVVLTLEPAAQEAAYAGLAGKEGAVVAIRPQTGEILAMATSPSYDPNRLAAADEAAQQAWDELTADPEEPLRNRAITNPLPPGSVFKLVTAAAALESGRYEPDTQVPGPAVLDLPLTTASLPNQSGQPCPAGEGGRTTLTSALAFSCNTSFASIGLDLGADALREQAQAFGFDEQPLPELNAATSPFPADPDEPQTALSAIGQFDVAATPLQVAMVSAAIANDGVLMRPYLVESILDPELEPIDTTQPQTTAKALATDNADALTQMMVEVVATGTGGEAQIPGVAVAGKTGTAQSAPGRPPYAWFTSFAPADDPQVAVAVVIEEADVAPTDISGGALAAPIAKAVMQAVLGP